MTTREAVFECTYASSAGPQVAHVRAWDADEAEELLRQELRADGVRARGAIVTRPVVTRSARTSPRPPG